MKNQYMLITNLSKNNNNTQNLGLELLRMLLSFWVVLFHCFKLKNRYLRKIIKKKILHVPTFIFISFYFLLKNLFERNIIKIKLRFERLLIPYFVYPIIVWTVNNLFYFHFKKNRFNRFLTFHDLIVQFIIGRKFIGVLWFQFNLIFFTLFFFIISFTFKNNFLNILQIIGILSYIPQFSEYNYNYFIKFKSPIKGTLGYFSETIPIAVTSLSFSSLNIIQKCKDNRKKSLFFSIIILYYIFHYDIFTDYKGFAYKGIYKNIGSLCLFIFFFLLPFEKIHSKKVKSFIKQITSYTQGIYCLHSIVRYYLQSIIDLVKNYTFFGCIIIYCISYLISFIGIKILGKTKFKHLFI